MDFLALAAQCAPAVHPRTMAAIVRVESNFNPFAIGVVGQQLERQPRDKAEAIATAKALEQAGYNFSVGAGQVNRHNLPKFGLDYDQAFDPCHSLRVGSLILKECYERARRRTGSEQAAVHASLSCYYSGGFTRGFQPDAQGQPSYVQKVLNAAAALSGSPPSLAGVEPISVLAAHPGHSAKPVLLAPASSTDITPPDMAANESDSVMVFR